MFMVYLSDTERGSILYYDDNDHDIQVNPILHAVLNWVPALFYYSHDTAAAYLLQLKQKSLGSF